MINYHKNDPQSIQKMFGSIAKKYDRANAILSLQMHKRWNSRLVNEVSINQNSFPLLDLCCGTGDIAFDFLKRASSPKKAILVDFCPEMLDFAKGKAERLNLTRHEIKYVQADVQKMPLKSNCASIATMAYGIRNVKIPSDCFHEVYRVLKPGGVFGILELTQPTRPIIRAGHDFYLKCILPVIGQWITSNKEAYQYLCSSIKHFVAPAQLEKELIEAGFKHTAQMPLSGGIATILIARKT